MKHLIVAVVATFLLTHTNCQKDETEEQRRHLYTEQIIPAKTLCPPSNPYSKLFPHGTCVGDSALPPNDDGFMLVPISETITYFGTNYNQIWVNNNGILSFDGGVSQFTPTPFPKPFNPNAIIAPYWSDIDTRFPRGGAVFYREMTAGAPGLARAEADVKNALPGIANFNAKIAFVVTWYDVTFFGASTIGRTKRNTFQCVIVSDGPRTFAFYLYDQLQWTTGTASGGNSDTGLGGTAAEIGFDAGDGVNWLIVPFSFDGGPLSMTQVTNINGPFTGNNGCWFNQFNLINKLAFIMKCLQDRTCCVMKGNVYTAKFWCSKFFQKDYLNHGGSGLLQCPIPTKFNTFPTVCTCDHAQNVDCVH